MRYLIKIIVFFYPALVFAWSYQDAKEQLLKNNPEYQSQTVSVAISRLDYQNARVTQLPSLTFQSGASRFLQEAGNSGYRVYFGPRINLPLYQGGRLRFNKRASLERYNAQNWMLEIQRIEKVKQLQISYAQALYAKEYLLLAKEILERGEKDFRLVELRYNSGLEYRWVYLTSKKNLAEDRLRVLESEMNQENALADLENLLGDLPIDSILELEEENFYHANQQEIDLDRVDVRKHPEYQLEVTKSKQSEHDVDISKSQRQPNINARFDFVIIETNNNPIVPFWSAGATMTMPLFEFGLHKRNQEIAIKQQEQQSLQASKKLLELNQRIVQAINEYKISKQKLEIAQMDLEAKMDQSKVTTEKYQNGLLDFDYWNRAQSSLTSAQNTMLTQKREWMVSYANLISLVGE